MTPTGERTRQLGWGVGVLSIVALLGALGTVLVFSSWSKWNLPQLVAISGIAIVSDLTGVEAGSGKLRVSGTLLGVMLAAVMLGPGPAVLVGVLAMLFGWFRWREPPVVLGVNLATHAWFPLASALLFHVGARFLHTGPSHVTYFFLVLPCFVVGLLVNFLCVAAVECFRERIALVEKVQEGLFPLLAAQLFSAVLITAAVYFVVNTGTVGIILLAVVLVIFQYLVGELLKSKQRAEELRRKATTDELTGVANRERFNAVLAEAITTAHDRDESFGVMLIDLDHFKEINDTLGHHYGDVLLRDLGPRLEECIGPEGTIARLGGDEFAILPAERTVDPERLGSLAAVLLECIQQPVEVDELQLEVGASIGISRFPLDGEDTHDLLRHADVAMYAAKQDHSSYKLYETKLDRHSVRRLTVLSDFRRALESNEFVLHYQPIVDIEAAHPRSAECLVRWEHPEFGLIPPADFIPIAEQSGLISPLTRYVLERAIVDCTAWRADGKNLSVGVNLSVRDLLDHDLPNEVMRLLSTYPLPPDALQLEITESMIMSDPERALATVLRLRELGVRISVDDFGTGYSSLSNLKRLPVNELKIDRSFISSMVADQSDLIIVRSTINLAHELRLKVTAEGVEDALTLSRLAMLGCDLAQGYHLSRPLPRDAFVDWLDNVGPRLADVAAGR